MNLERTIRNACLLECSAPKVGNVTPRHSFEDLTYDHFARSAPITAQWMAQAAQIGVGAAVEGAASELMRSVGQNTHLGIVLLLAPLAASEDRSELGTVLNSLTVEDAKAVYRAIRIMEPGGLGKADDQDVHDEPTASLLDCMRLAADRDTIAKQYATGFEDVFRFAESLEPADFENDWQSAVVRLQLRIMAMIPDTLIARKCGKAVAEEGRNRAQVVLDGGADTEAISGFDDWLRADGHRRNPGTTADLIAAVLFVALREERIVVPSSLT